MPTFVDINDNIKGYNKIQFETTVSRKVSQLAKHRNVHLQYHRPVPKHFNIYKQDKYNIWAVENKKNIYVFFSTFL